MKVKSLQIFVLLFIYALSTKGQSAFEISDKNGNIVTNTTLNIPIDYFEQVSYILNVTNKSNTSKLVKMKKSIQVDLSGANITMCSGAFCHSPSTLITPNAVSLNPNANLLSINEEFHLVFQPFGNVGLAEVKYIIFEDGGNDSVFVLARFNSITVSLNTIYDDKNLNITFENNQVKIKNESELPYTLEVYDLLGKKIKSLSHREEETHIDLPLKQVYQLRYSVDGKVYAKKLISN